MKRFVFKYQTIETLRKTNEEIALKNFSLAQKKYRDEVETKQKMINDMQKSLKRREMLAASSAAPSSLILEDQFIEGQKIRIQHQDRAILKAHKQMQKALVQYKTERKKLKTIEKLRENEQEKFKKARAKFEQSQIEDLMIMRARFQEEDVA